MRRASRRSSRTGSSSDRTTVLLRPPEGGFQTIGTRERGNGSQGNRAERIRPASELAPHQSKACLRRLNAKCSGAQRAPGLVGALLAAPDLESAKADFALNSREFTRQADTSSPPT